MPLSLPGRHWLRRDFDVSVLVRSSLEFRRQSLFDALDVIDSDIVICEVVSSSFILHLTSIAAALGSCLVCVVSKLAEDHRLRVAVRAAGQDEEGQSAPDL